jgi:hypothetical protein
MVRAAFRTRHRADNPLRPLCNLLWEMRLFPAPILETRSEPVDRDVRLHSAKHHFRKHPGERLAGVLAGGFIDRPMTGKNTNEADSLSAMCVMHIKEFILVLASEETSVARSTAVLQGFDRRPLADAMELINLLESAMLEDIADCLRIRGSSLRSGVLEKAGQSKCHPGFAIPYLLPPFSLWRSPHLALRRVHPISILFAAGTAMGKRATRFRPLRRSPFKGTANHVC